MQVINVFWNTFHTFFFIIYRFNRLQIAVLPPYDVTNLRLDELTTKSISSIVYYLRKKVELFILAFRTPFVSLLFLIISLRTTVFLFQPLSFNICSGDIVLSRFVDRREVCMEIKANGTDIVVRLRLGWSLLYTFKRNRNLYTKRMSNNMTAANQYTARGEFCW